MNKINIIITTEVGSELIEVIKMLSDSKRIFSNRFKKYNTGNLHYLQYLIIKSFYPSFFNDYDLNFIKYSSKIYLNFNKSDILVYANKYKDIYDISNKEITLDLFQLIKVFNDDSSNNFDKYKYLLYLIMIRICKNIETKDGISKLTFYPKKDFRIIDKDISSNLYKCKVKDNINKDLGYFINSLDAKHIHLLSKGILSKASLEILNDYCVSNNISITQHDSINDLNLDFSQKILIIPEAFYLKNLKTYFNFPGNFIFLI